MTRNRGDDASPRDGKEALETMKFTYRTGDFLPLFLRRLFAKTVYWLTGTLLATAVGVCGIYALSMALSGMSDRLSRAGAWLLLPVILLAAFAGFSLQSARSAARVMMDFYRKGGGAVEIRVSGNGVEVRGGHGSANVGWGEATRFDVRRSGFIVWKGSEVPIVLPARRMESGQYARILNIASESLAGIRAEAERRAAADAAEADAVSVSDNPDNQAGGKESPFASESDVAAAPDYSDSEYRFGDEWVPGGIRFHFSVTAQDRDALMQYSLSRPSSRRGMLALAIGAAAMAAWLLVSYLTGDRSVMTVNLILAILSAGMSFLFITAVVRPPLFMRIAERLPGARKRRNSAVRHVFCVMSDGVMYAKTEGNVDRVEFGAFHDMVLYRDWLFLFKDKKTAYILPLRFLDEEHRTAVYQALGERLRGNPMVGET